MNRVHGTTPLAYHVLERGQKVPTSLVHLRLDGLELLLSIPVLVLHAVVEFGYSATKYLIFLLEFLNVKVSFHGNTRDLPDDSG